MAKSTILVCGPSPAAVGGGPTHMRTLWASPLASAFDLVLFETGSRGAESPAREERPLAMLWRLVLSPFALAGVIARCRPAVVHLNTSMTPKGFWREIAHLAVCRLSRRRVVYQIHGGSLPEMTRAPWMRSVVRVVLGWPDAVVLLASAEKPEYEHLDAVRRIAVIPNAVDTAEFRGCAGREHSGSVRRLAYLGRLNGDKGELESVVAAGMLHAEPGFRDLELRVAGTGPAQPAIEDRIARLGLGGCVRLIGAIHGDEKVRFLRETDVLLLPTYHAEGLPYVILESLAAGTPVVTTRNGGIPDVVHDHVHGLFVEPREPAQIAAALREMAASPERLRAMSRACSEWAEQELGLARLARQFSALYRELGAR